ncbi:hypothetical protein D3C76_1638810 [compost metagenome]
MAAGSTAARIHVLGRQPVTCGQCCHRGIAGHQLGTLGRVLGQHANPQVEPDGIVITATAMLWVRCQLTGRRPQ